MRFLYTLSIYFYLFVIRLASLFNGKAKLWLKGRAIIFERIQAAVEGFNDVVWFHCASLGEFEQGRPLMEKIKKDAPTTKILLTFFSPSGFEIRKNYPGADWIFYLPIDTPSNAKRFVRILKPKAAFFVKYEFWFNYLRELNVNRIPTYLVSGIFRPNHYFFKPSGSWARKQLKAFSHFFVQDQASEELLLTAGYKNVTVAGDTRFDRVFEIASNAKQIELVKQFVGKNKCLIAGSTWPEDEKIISEATFSDFKLIIAPHEIGDSHIEAIELLFKSKNTVRFSKANVQNIAAAQVLIVDNIGMLSSLYQYGTIAYIGGGFGKGIHNILEAATFGLPVIFGPNYEKFAEAKDLIKLGGAFSITSTENFNTVFKLLNDEPVHKTASHVARFYVNSKVGASKRILDRISL